MQLPGHICLNCIDSSLKGRAQPQPLQKPNPEACKINQHLKYDVTGSNHDQSHKCNRSDNSDTDTSVKNEKNEINILLCIRYVKKLQKSVQ